MKLRRIMSAMLAAALVTSTVAFAEDTATRDIYLTVENDKGTYTFTEEESAAFVDYFNKENNFDEVNTFNIPPVYIYGEDSGFTATDGNKYSLNEVFQVDFEFIDIQKDADGNTTFKKLYKANTSHPISGTSMWGPCSANDEGYTFTDTTITVSELIGYMDNWGKANIIYAEISDDGGDVPDEPAFTHEDVDMILIWFYMSDEFNENGNAIHPSDDNYKFYGDWFISESAVEMLNEANSGTTAPDDTTNKNDGTAADDSTDTSADDNTDTSADGEDASDNSNSDDNAGSTDGADGEDKNSADTGAQGVAAAAGIALAAGAAVLFSRKRK